MGVYDGRFKNIYKKFTINITSNCLLNCIGACGKCFFQTVRSSRWSYRYSTIGLCVNYFYRFNNQVKARFYSTRKKR